MQTISKPFRKAALKALTYCERNLRTNIQKPISVKTIRKHFGNHSFGDYLVSTLLVRQENSFYTVGVNGYSYYLNKRGLKTLKLQLADPELEQQIKQSIFSQFDNEYLEDAKNGFPNYSEKKDRYYHPLQNEKSELRDEWLHRNGFRHSFDIACAAPTMIVGKAKTLSKRSKFNAVDQYLMNKKAIRAKIAKETNLTVDQIKTVINALLNGARLTSPSSYNPHGGSIYKLVGEEGIVALRNNEFIKELRKEFSKAFRVIKTDTKIMNEVKEELCEDIKKVPQFRSCVYRKLEKQVMAKVYEELDKRDITYFKLHDGFFTVETIVIDEIEDILFDAIKFEVKIENN